MNVPEAINFCLVCGAPMEQKQAFGRLRYACTACRYIHFEDPKVAVAVLVEQNGRVLLVRRVNVPHQGKWTLPAGFIEGDEDPREAARRECLEETGLEVRVTDLMDVISGKEHPHGASIVIVYRAEVEGGALNPNDDADAAIFYPPDHLPPLAFRATRQALDLWRARR